MPIPPDRCQRCTMPLDENDTWTADRDRVCGVCAKRAEARGEPVERVEADAPAPG